MHGRIKVKTTEEQQKAKALGKEKKLQSYKKWTAQIFEKRSDGELDEELLKLTGDVLSANPDFYTLWNIRKEIFIKWKSSKSDQELDECFTNELRFLESCLKVNFKSYGAWQHRCFVMETMSSPDFKSELDLCSKFLEYDDRNFHCWDYRRFIVHKSKTPLLSEFNFTTSKIQADFSNFSSWHYRSHLLRDLFADETHFMGVEEDVYFKELQLVQNAQFTDPSDQSGWFYHRWLLLGDKKADLKIQSVFIDKKSSKMWVTLSNVSKINKDFLLFVYLKDGEELNSSWQSCNGKYYETIFYCDIDSGKYFPQLTGQEAASELKLVLKSFVNSQMKEVMKVDIKIEAQCSFYRWVSDENQFCRNLCNELSKPIYKEQILSMTQLHELEPENKWVINALILLMRATDPVGYSENCLNYYEQLCQLDSYRFNYYNDQKSCLKIEKILPSHNPNQRSFNFSNLDLISLHHTDYFLHCRCLDLSGNKLTAVPDLQRLPYLEILNIARNKIENIKASMIVNGGSGVISLVGGEKNIGKDEDLSVFKEGINGEINSVYRINGDISENKPACNDIIEEVDKLKENLDSKGKTACNKKIDSNSGLKKNQLNSLTILDLTYNNINKLEDMMNLSVYNKLETLLLDGNPIISQVPNYKDKIKQFLPSIMFFE